MARPDSREPAGIRRDAPSGPLPAFGGNPRGGHPARRPPLSMARRLAALLFAMMIALSAVTLLVSTWLRSTAFTADWYRPILSDPEFLDGVRTAATQEIATQGARYNLPASVLTHGLDNQQVSAYLNKYLDNFVEFLNGRDSFRAPDLAVDLISTPIIAYARDAAAKFGLKLTAEQEQQLRGVAVQLARLAQDRLNLIADASFLTSPAFERWRFVLHTLSTLAIPAAVALGTALLLLLLVLAGRVRSTLLYAAVSVWLAAGLVFASVAVVQSTGFPASLAITESWLRSAALDLSTRALSDLMQRSLLALAAASAVLLALLVFRPRRGRSWASGI